MVATLDLGKLRPRRSKRCHKVVLLLREELVLPILLPKVLSFVPNSRVTWRQLCQHTQNLGQRGDGGEADRT